MRRILLVPCMLIAVGCAKEPKVEAPPVGPAALVAADAAGTLEGTTMAETTDSVLSTWTAHQVAAADGLTGKFVNHATTKDTVTYATTFSADSAVSVSSVYTDATMPKGTPPLKWRAVGRANGHEWTGTVTIMVAATDSVLQRAKWKATHSPTP